MYLSNITIENFRCFGDGVDRFELTLRRGLTALVGENDTGKSSVIDALRFALGTTDLDWHRLEDSDFYNEETMREIKIVCKFERLTEPDKRAFLEYLTYGKEREDEPVLCVNWCAKDTGKERYGKSFRQTDMRSGKNGDGPTFDPEVKRLLATTYLRPLRDAEQALSARRGSRLAQILQHANLIKAGDEYDSEKLLKDQELSVLAIGKLLNILLEEQKGVKNTRDEIDKSIEELCIKGDRPKSNINVSGGSVPDNSLLRELLEKLDLRLSGSGKSGLGSDNLLFMACELLLLEQVEDGNKMLLIEEPEAHLHPQRQLRVIKHLQELANKKRIQIVVTTHSPNLASAIDLNNMVMIHRGRAFSLAEGETNLEPSDYRFLKRFLDVTKANLFFARGVMIVEGDAENILLPTLAHILGRDFTEHGVSIVNVGGMGLRRYARIFQRRDMEKNGQLNIPVACVTDMDVMPNCAPVITGKIKENDACPEKHRRRWLAKGDFSDNLALESYRKRKDSKATGQHVKTFISNEWTLEYDLTLGPKDERGKFSLGLAEDVFVAACLAKNDEEINARTIQEGDVIHDALAQFAEMKVAVTAKDGCKTEEVLASEVYSKFAKDGVSKAIAAQHLSEWLMLRYECKSLTAANLREWLPQYLTEAVDYVTGANATVTELDVAGAADE